jgi:glycosyltransferase involved in cell wall biosynthesis
MADDLALSIVIPAFDEEHRIGATLEATQAFLADRPGGWEVLVVDDGSRDGTAGVIARHHAAEPRVRLLSQPRNRGKGAAVRAGVLASRGARVLFMDADLATPLGELAKLERALDAGADVAIGSRALPDSRIEVHQHPLREAMGKAFNLMVRFVAFGGFRDTQCGFKLFTRAAAHALFEAARIDRYAFDVEILLLARGRFRVDEVPVVWRHIERSKVSPLRDGLRTGFDLVALRLDVATRRLRGRPRRGSAG